MITIDVKTLLIALLIIAAIVLVIFLIVCTAKLIKTLVALTKVLNDAETVTAAVAKRTKEIDGQIEKVQKAIKGTADAAKANQRVINLFKAVVGVVKAVSSFAKKDSGSEDTKK
jgi:uncharacterized protein YoxC